MWTLTSKHDQFKKLYGESALTWLDHLYQKSDIGFLDIAQRRSELSAIQNLALEKRSVYKNIAILGIGGSALGTIALFEACAPDWIRNNRIIFFDNVDATTFYEKLDSIENPIETLWVLISKSGNTIETLTQAEFIDQFLQKKYKARLAQHSVVITEEKSSDLYDWAQANKVAVLGVPLDVGGRFSVLTAVGLFPAAFAGLNVESLLKGAEEAKGSKEFLASVYSVYWSSFVDSAHAAYFFAYADRLSAFGMWIEQLWAESLGKKKKENGENAPAIPIPIACRGATDQHSVLQQIAHGTQDKCVTVLRVGASESSSHVLGQTMFRSTRLMEGKSIGELLKAEAIATSQALFEENIKTLNLQVENLNEQTVGFLFMAFEIWVASLGLALGLNPFDQPGVERGKVLARELLSLDMNKL